MKRLSIVFVTLASVLLLGACDTATTNGGDTIVINKDNQSGANVPRIRFSVPYGQGDVSGSFIEVASTNSDDLGNLLSRVAAASRDDVVRATVDSVLLERISPTSKDGTPVQTREKVFTYLQSAEVYFGDSASGPRIADQTISSTDRQIALTLDRRDVTSAVQSGARPVFLRLETNDPSSVPSSEEVSITVWFELEIAQ